MTGQRPRRPRRPSIFAETNVSPPEVSWCDSHEVNVEGEYLAAYELHEKLGVGGMGAVYRATDRRIGRAVAIKIIRQDRLPDETARERFTREARSIGGLNHPNVATLFDVSLTGDRPFIVLEYLPGGSLHDRLRAGPLPMPEILRIAEGVAAGLEHAHAQGITHRDLKPANVLFSATGVPKIIDFGLAALPESPTVTEPGTVVGTADYMSPEQACGAAADHRSDIFSFGVLLYRMAAGRHPFQCESVPATLHKIVYDPQRPLQEVRHGLPEAFIRLVNWLLEKDPDKRPQRMREVLAELRSIEQSFSGVVGATETMVVPVAPRRRRRPWLAAAVLLAALLSVAGWLLWRRSSPRLPATRELAVLPFENLSHDPLEQAFCDGLVELLTSSLTQMERFHSTLWVIPSADVRRLQLHSVSDARKAFPVNLVVTGSLQSYSNQVLVVVNLSDAATGRQLTSRIVPVNQSERSQLIPKLMAALLDLLDLGAGGNVPRNVQPQVSSANDSYLQGKGLLQPTATGASVDQAISLLEQSVRLDPSFAPSQTALADACLRHYTRTRDQEWLAKADQAVNRSLELDGTQAAAHLVLGRLYRATGRSAQAITEIQRAMALDPMNVAAYTNLALAYGEAGRPADAERTYLEAMRIRPSYWPAYTNLGIFYEQRGEYAKAVEPFSLVVKLVPDFAEAHNNLGTLFYFLDRFDDALVEFDRALALHPTPLFYSNRAMIYFQRADYPAARDAYRKAVDLDPRDPLYWGNLADTETQIAGAAGEARDAYQRAIALSRERLALNPRDADLLGRMALYLARISDCAEAGRRIEEARGLAPDRVALTFKAAKIADACHDRPAAIRYLESAIRKGYSRREVDQDPDLEPLRRTSAYAAMRARTSEVPSSKEKEKE
jgi:serine/threonine protein kinase/Flp pilus assembly protein TadD